MAVQLRPNRIDDIIGNEQHKIYLKIIAARAKAENRPVPHMLFEGHYGCGKTSFANAIAGEMGANFIETNASAIKNNKDLIAVITRIKQNDILFIDEIHGLKKRQEELLYTVMEDFKLPLTAALLPKLEESKIKNLDRVFNLPLPPFTLIGATTDIGNLSGPLISRFKGRCQLDLYSVKEIQRIILKNAMKFQIDFEPDASLELAKRCKAIPRLANNRLQWINDYIRYHRRSRVKKADVIEAMKLQEIDENGFDRNDLSYLKAVAEMQPCGISSIAARTGQSIETITKYIEPYLLYIGIVKITGQGRMLSSYAGEITSDIIPGMDLLDKI